MSNTKEGHHPKNVTIYKKDELLPDIGDFTDVLFTIPDMYSSSDSSTDEARSYAVEMTRSHFGVTIESALNDFEIIIIPVVSFYDDSGRILARKIR
jgi:hypothetical protein